MNLENIKSLQMELSSLFGVSGFENEVSDYILNKVENEDLADKVWKDPLGNVLAIKEGEENKNRILFDAHIDEIGFMISHIEKSGFLRFVLVGNWDIRILLGQAVILKSKSGKLLHGIIGSKPPHLTSPNERKRLTELTNMYIDVGMNSYDDVMNNGLEIGSVGTLYDPFVEFPNNMVRGKAFDDRTGCNVLLQLMMELKQKPTFDDTFLFNFAVQEEFGRIGAVTGAFKLKPTMALAIENTTAGDVPDIKESKIPVYIGKGPAITMADKSIICSPYLNKRLIENAKFEKIPFQIKKPMYGLTDAGKIQLTREGVPSTVVSVPCRYIHSPTSLLKLDDILNTIRLLEAFIKNSAKI
ncbi:MAG: M42 family metallopeptidase [Candidatus Hodarchaeota archaeon]